VLEVSRSGYYQWIKYPKSTRKIEDMKLKQKIVEIHRHSRRTYGSPRIHQQLVREDYQVSKKRVERLMKEAGIHAMAKKKYRATTDSKHTLPVAANHLNRNFSVHKLKSVLDGRYHLHLYPRRLALSIHHYGPVFP
jgi:putative transposase